MTSFDLTICDVEDFVAEVTAQVSSLEEAASTQEILSQQIEGYLSRLRESMCTDVTNLKAQIDACDCSGGGGSALPDLEEGVEVASGRQVQTTGALEDSFFKLIDLGALPNATSKTVAHGIARPFTVVSMYGASNDPVGLFTIPLPFVNGGSLTAQVTMFISGINIELFTHSIDRTAFTDSYVILEYVKS